MRLQNLTSAQFQEKLKQVDTAILPVGMVEAHGGHCPLGTDIFIPERLIQEIESKMGGEVFIAPTVNYGHGTNTAGFFGTINLPSKVLEDYVYHIGAELGRWGIKNVLLLNGHGGNIPALTNTMERLWANHDMTVMLNSWWVDFEADVLAICKSRGHGGEDETSAILAIDEKLVDMDQAQKNLKRPVAQVFWSGMEQEILPQGMSGDATVATKAKGQELFSVMADKLIVLIGRLLAGDFVE